VSCQLPASRCDLQPAQVDRGRGHPGGGCRRRTPCPQSYAQPFDGRPTAAAIEATPARGCDTVPSTPPLLLLFCPGTAQHDVRCLYPLPTRTFSQQQRPRGCVSPLPLGVVPSHFPTFPHSTHLYLGGPFSPPPPTCPPPPRMARHLPRPSQRKPSCAASRRRSRTLWPSGCLPYHGEPTRNTGPRGGSRRARRAAAAPPSSYLWWAPEYEVQLEVTAVLDGIPLSLWSPLTGGHLLA